MRPLTPRQREILNYIIASIRDRDRFPSYREIGRRFRLTSSATVSQHLDALAKKGALTRVGKQLRLAPGHRLRQGVPIVGRVAAGLPIMAIENREGWLDVSTLFGDEVTHFAVRVNGDSMQDAGIFDGDYVVVRHDEDARDGDVVVAYLGDDEATVKVMRKHGKTVELEPRNASYKSIRIDSKRQNLRIGGKVVGLVRKIR
ncbi:MAG TPA: transcriptional repressor LexA [bacterium]|nr:transcriptional repressor LexA [bacterium]